MKIYTYMLFYRFATNKNWTNAHSYDSSEENGWKLTVNTQILLLVQVWLVGCNVRNLYPEGKSMNNDCKPVVGFGIVSNFFQIDIWDLVHCSRACFSDFSWCLFLTIFALGMHFLPCTVIVLLRLLTFLVYMNWLFVYPIVSALHWLYCNCLAPEKNLGIERIRVSFVLVSVSLFFISLSLMYGWMWGGFPTGWIRVLQ